MYVGVLMTMEVFNGKEDLIVGGRVVSMGNYITDTFARMDLQQIREFLLNGTELFIGVDDEPYDIRLKRESDPIYNRLESLYSDRIEMDKAAADLSRALTAYAEIYMEIGMKAGARLVHQLLFEDNPTPSIQAAERRTP